MQNIFTNDNYFRKTCTLLGRDKNGDHLQDATKKDFSTLKNLELESLITICNKENQVNSKFPKKGK